MPSIEEEKALASLYFANRRSSTFRGEDSLSNGCAEVNQFYSRPVMLNGVAYSADYSDYNKVIQPNLAEEKPIGSLLIERKIPVKVEPKVNLANERTFLAWMHSTLWLFGVSVTILKYSDGDPIKIVHGSLIMPVVVFYILYSISQFTRRSEMLKRKAPGPYEDTTGPVIYALFLVTTITAQFFINLQLK